MYHIYHISILVNLLVSKNVNLLMKQSECRILLDYSDSFSLILFFVFLALHLQHMEIPRLGVKLELSLPFYATATATLDPSHICDLHHSLWQPQISNPLSEARDQIHILLATSWVSFCCATAGTPNSS